jgi:hypothetical protein
MDRTTSEEKMSPRAQNRRPASGAASRCLGRTSAPSHPRIGHKFLPGGSTTPPAPHQLRRRHRLAKAAAEEQKRWRGDTRGQEKTSHRVALRGLRAWPVRDKLRTSLAGSRARECECFRLTPLQPSSVRLGEGKKPDRDWPGSLRPKRSAYVLLADDEPPAFAGVSLIAAARFELGTS